MKCILDRTTGELFTIPNFCIVDPVHERDFNVYNNKEIKEKKINLIMTNLINNTQIDLQLSNKTTGEKLKLLYSEKTHINLKKYKIRLLSKGQEIKDDLYLYHFNLDNNSHIHVSLFELD